MKSLIVRTALAALLGGIAVSQGHEPMLMDGGSEAANLLAIGPVESLNLQTGTAVILGQRVVLGSEAHLAVGETVAVFGRVLSDGRLLATSVLDRGTYVAGATQVLLSGTVERNDESLGRAVVSGVNVDLTPMMSNGALALRAGSKVEIVGMQPLARGLILVSGVSGGGLSGVSGGGLSGVSGGGFSGVSGGGLRGVSGGGLSGVSGGGLSGVSGGGFSGVSGGGLRGNIHRF